MCALYDFMFIRQTYQEGIAGGWENRQGCGAPALLEPWPVKLFESLRQQRQAPEGEDTDACVCVRIFFWLVLLVMSSRQRGSVALTQPRVVRSKEKQDVAGEDYKKKSIGMLITKKQASKKKYDSTRFTMKNSEERGGGSEETRWWEVLFFYATAGGSQACSHGQPHSLQYCTE